MDRSRQLLAEQALTIRRSLLTMIYHAGSGHPGGSLSCVDLIVYLINNVLKWQTSDYCRNEGDRFVLSKGHACPALYAAAAEAGLVSPQELLQLRCLDSSLQGHPSVNCLPWVETCTGSLGQGFSVAIGMALGLRYKKEHHTSYVMLGDGELQEGQVWEGIMFAAHQRLDNLCAMIDYNKMQSDDYVENVIAIEPLKAKWEAFNWHVLEIDGHDFMQIEQAFKEAKRVKRKPVVIIAHTVKGKGVSFMEGSTNWHGSIKLKEEDFVRALKDLATTEEEIGRCLNGSTRQ